MFVICMEKLYIYIQNYKVPTKSYRILHLIYDLIIIEIETKNNLLILFFGY